ncbi:DUF1127 domain-containing protein [Halomonas salinarum]|uniref:DUF1127 domain-containing protein n=1 Tax=Halomonas salinarum TaxID=1158993 RepID=UPI001438D9B4|nr:DUF1127 domain-containing protein [Halomonas salinarum]
MRLAHRSRLLALFPRSSLTRLAERYERLRHRLHYLRQRQASRRELLALDDHQLRDIGKSRRQAEQEGRKRFWQDLRRLTE